MKGQGKRLSSSTLPQGTLNSNFKIWLFPLMPVRRIEVKNAMAVLGHMQIPLKLVALRLGLSFINFFQVCFVFFSVFWLFFSPQKQRDRPAEGVCYIGIFWHMKIYLT